MGGGKGRKGVTGNIQTYSDVLTAFSEKAFKSEEDFEDAAETFQSLFEDPNSGKRLSELINAYEKGTPLTGELLEHDMRISNEILRAGVALPMTSTVSVKGKNSSYGDFKINDVFDVNSILKGHKGTVPTRSRVRGGGVGSVVFKITVPKGYTKGAMSSSIGSIYKTVRNKNTGDIEEKRISKASIGGNYILSNSITGRVKGITKSTNGTKVVHVELHKQLKK